MRLSKAEIAYVAGLFDGEGCINFTNSNNDVTYLRVLVSNTNYEILKYLQDTFGGSISELKKASPKWKQGYQWSLNWAAALAFVDKIRPWLKIKQKQAQVVYAFAELKKVQRKKKISQEKYLEALELLKQQLTTLNAKGHTGETRCLSSTEKANRQFPKT